MPPEFWFRPPGQAGWRARLLSPVAWLFAAATARRVAQAADVSPDIPVICIGNLNIGGSGKTPTAIAIAERLINSGRKPHFVSRGYGGKLGGPVRVDETIHRADDVGDEPLLLAAFAPTWIAKTRSAGVIAAQRSGADVIILDDGFQNPGIAKDISIVVVDATVGFGNGRVFPAGPLREPVQAGLKRADLLLSVGAGDSQSRFNGIWQDQIQIPICRGELVPLKTGMDWNGLRVLAFAGIGRPEKFFATLRALNADLVQCQSLDDHQPYSTALITRLTQDAARLDAQLVTTEKDAVRLPPEFLSQVLSLVVRLEIDDWGPIDGLLNNLKSSPPD